MFRAYLLLSLVAAGTSALAQTNYDAKILEYTGLRYACGGTTTPVLKIQNVGSQTMSGCVVETWKNGIQVNSFDWQLAVSALQGDIRQPSFPDVNVQPGDELEFRIISVNTIPDEDPIGNITSIDIDQTPALANGGDVEVEIALGDDAGSVTWSVKNALNVVVATGGPYDTSNSTTTEALALTPGECYTFQAEDAFRSVTGSSVKVKRDGNTLIQTTDLSSLYTKGLETAAGGGCTNDLVLSLSTDSLGSETQWEIVQEGTEAVMCMGASYPDDALTHEETCCLPDGCYLLRVSDLGGDGIAGGGYVLRTNAGKRIIDNTGNFQSGSLSAIGNNGSFCLPLGDDRLITASCDRLELQRGVTSACSDRLTANNLHGGGNIYQFWIYDPNGLAPDTLIGPGSNILAMNQLQGISAGVLYNVRVRTRISPGVWRPWGPACRMSISASASPCRTTKLVDDPGSPNFSCGKTVTLPAAGGGNGAANRLVAKPVTRLNANCVSVAANKYQFRFKDTDTQVVTVINGVGTNYYCYMTRPTFDPCKVYEVEVRASFNGSGGPWCTYGEICTVSTAGGCFGNAEERMVGTNVIEKANGFHLYPNPNQGDQVFLSIDAVKEGVNTVSVDIYDTFGRRVSTRTLAVMDGAVHAGMAIHGEMAAGLYVVHVTAGDAAYTERLVVRP